MPEKNTNTKSRKAPTTQAGKYVHEEIEHVRDGKHGARNAKQAIAIGLQGTQGWSETASAPWQKSGEVHLQQTFAEKVGGAAARSEARRQGIGFASSTLQSGQAKRTQAWQEQSAQLCKKSSAHKSPEP